LALAEALGWSGKHSRPECGFGVRQLVRQIVYMGNCGYEVLLEGREAVMTF